MAILTAWIAGKGLDLSQEALGSVLGIPTFDGVARERLATIEQKLDTLIRAPFRQAQFYLRERDFASAKNKLIEAISHDEFDLSAQFLYSLILCWTGNAELGLFYLEELVHKFGPHPALIPAEIRDIFAEYITDVQPLRSIAPFKLDMDSRAYYAAEVRCTLSGIVILWRPHPGTEYGGGWIIKVYNWPQIFVYDWNGAVKFKIDAHSTRTIAGVTNRFLVLRRTDGLLFTRDAIEVLRITDGALVSTATTQQDIESTFNFDTRISLVVRSDRPVVPSTHHFAGARIAIVDGGARVEVTPVST